MTGTIEGLVSIRESAQGFIEAYTTHEDDFAGFVEAATPICKRLIQRPDLLTLGFPIGTHRTALRLLYGDGDLSIIIAEEPNDIPVPVHDHGMWEMLGLWRGRIEHYMYERLDDGSQPGIAELKEIERSMLEAGDVVCVPPPPHDIHGFTPVEEFSYFVAILPGWYNNVRRYFDPERNSYFLYGRTPV
jgi:3-mercaptopropionate dioxygenase